MDTNKINKMDTIKQYNEDIQQLQKEKDEYMKMIKNIDSNIVRLTKSKHLFCYSTGGHDWITESEDGPYGDTYRYCSKCNMQTN